MTEVEIASHAEKFNTYLRRNFAMCGNTRMINPILEWGVELKPSAHPCKLYEIMLSDVEVGAELIARVDDNKDVQYWIDFIRGRRVEDTYYLSLVARLA